MSTLKAYWLKKIGNHRGAPRIWLDMPRLAEAGLAPGARFDLDVVPHGIRIRASDTGARCVSAKTLKSGVQLPIIDINSKESLSTFDGHGHVRVIVRADAVYVLHCFQKKTAQTSLKDIELARKRFRDLVKEQT